jgi:hypothetical protein
MKRFILLILLIYLTNTAKTQLNPLYMTAPLLPVDINSKTGAMGETDVALTKKSYFTGPYQNPSLLVKSDKTSGTNISYLPDITDFSKGDFAANILLFHKWNDQNTIGSVYTYFNSGEFLNSNYFQPYDYYINLNYAHSFNNNLSTGAAIKYIYSNLCGNSHCREKYHPGRSFAVDLGIDFENELDLAEDLSVNYDFGAAIENLGPRFSYTDYTEKQYLPARLAIGTMLSFFDKTDEKTKFMFTVAYQAEKLLVPTPPVYYNDSLDVSGDKVIKEGREPPSSLPLSWIQSFYDAPGGFKEEWHEILHKFGVELSIEFSENFKSALRYGRFCEHLTKGNRKYNTFGAGLYIYGITLDARLVKGNRISLDNCYGFTAGLQPNL